MRCFHINYLMRLNICRLFLLIIYFFIILKLKKNTAVVGVIQIYSSAIVIDIISNDDFLP